MASVPITYWQIDGEKVETGTDFIFLGSRITADGDWSHKIKRHLLLGSKAMTNLDSILKSRDITLLTKVHIVKATIFSKSHVQMWDLAHKEGWALKNWCFQLWCWRRLLRVPWTARRSILKEINPEHSLEGLMLEIKLQYFGHLMQAANSLEKTLMLGKGRRAGEEESRRGWNSWTALPNQRTWVWANWQTVKDREVWRAAVHAVAKNRAQLSDWTTQ